MNFKIQFVSLAAAVVVTAQLAFSQPNKTVNRNLTTLERKRIVKEIDSLISSKMNQHSVLAVSVSIVDGQSTIMAKGYGYTDLSKKRKVDEKTLFSMQSVSKSLTTTAFLMEATEGKFRLDDKVKSFYPALEVQSRSGVKEEEKMTFRHLLSHRAGFSHEAPLGNNYDTTQYSFEEHIKSFNGSWLKFGVEEFYSYSNMGHDLAAYILTKNGGEPVEEYLKKRLLTPLEMNRTTFNQQQAYQSGNMAMGYFGNKVLQRTYIPNIASGGVYSNADDMARYLKFQLNDGKINKSALLSSDLINEMRTVQFKLDGQAAGYGLGVLIKPFYGTTLIFHPGDGYGYQALHAYIPQAGVGIALLTNDGVSSPFTNEVYEYALKLILRAKDNNALTDSLSAPNKAITNLKPEYLKKLEGRYKSGRRLVSLTESDGSLAVISDIDTLKLHPHSQSEFSANNGERFLFYFDKSEKPTHFINLNEYTADFYIYNDSPGEQVGPAKPAWRSMIGTYTGFNNRQPQTLQVFIKNGYLYCSKGGETKLTEFKEGIFFTSDGDSFIKKGDTIYLGNRPFIKN